MKSWPFAVFSVACLAIAGCRTAPAVALLEKENRDLEMQVYELADLVEDTRRENVRLQQRLKRGERDDGAPGLGPPGESPDSFLEPELPEPEPLEVPSRLQSPKVEMPSASISGDEFLQRLSGRTTTAPSDRLPAPPSEEALDSATESESGTEVQLDLPTAGDAVPCRADNAQVAAITLDDRLTGGYDLDHRRVGHEGIITVVQPRDADGQLVAAAAPLSVVVLDPALPGEAARLARWDLTAEEAAKRYRKTPLSEGIHLELVWPGDLPIHRRLHLFVRYVTDDGRKLEADKGIEIEVPVLEAQRPTRPPTAQSIRGTTAPPTEWQRRRPPSTQAPADESPRTALAPPRRDARPVPAERPQPESSPQSPPSTRDRPVWSPDRP